MEVIDPRAALDALVARGGESYAALSRLIGRNAAYLQQFVRRGSPRLLAERDRRLLAAYFGVSEAALGGPAQSSEAMVAVPRIDAAASAGPGGLVEDDRQAGLARFDPGLIARLGVRSDALSIIRATGDSMLPGIADGDEMLVDASDRQPTRKGAVYVLRAEDGVMVKRVARRALGLAITSDNPAFPGVDPARAEILGRVVLLTRAL